MLPVKRVLGIDLDQRGAALLTAMLFLLLLTLMGTFALMSTDVEVKISGHDKDYLRDFYVSDSGWQEALPWLNNSGIPPAKVNLSLDDPNDNIVKNFGNGGDGVTNDNFSAGTQDGTLSGTPYWNRIEHESDSVVPGSSKEYRRFTYKTTSIANGRQEIEVKINKIYKVGY